MKKIFTIITTILAFSTTVLAQQYQMDVLTKDGRVTSYLLESVNDVTYKDGKTIVNIKDKPSKEYDNLEIQNISWSEPKSTIGANGNGSFTVDGHHTAIVTPNYSVQFYSGCITNPTTLTVNKVSDTPKFLEAGEENVVAYDFKLDGQSQLDGIAEIRLPVKAGKDDWAFAVYYNQDTKEWEPVNNYYDESTGEVVISTNHFSLYKAFSLKKEEGYVAWLELLDRDALVDHLAKPKISYSLLANHLEGIVNSDDPEKAALETFAGKYSDLSQIGLDIGFNAVQSLGLESEFLSGFSDLLGHLGTALSVYQICRNDFRGEDAQVAGNTLKLCLTQITSKLASACASNIMLASMASVAMIDYSINKFATEGWSGRKDLYWKTYDLYYNKRAGDDPNGKLVYGMEDWEWKWKLLPYFKKKNITNKELNDLIDEEVTNYCNKIWNDYSGYSFCLAEATELKYTAEGGMSSQLQEELSNRMRGYLYQWVIPFQIDAIKKELEQEAYDKFLSLPQLKEYMKKLNSPIVLDFYDSSIDEEKEDMKSAYEGYKVRFKNYPEDTPQGLFQFEVKLDEKGTGKIQTRVGLLAYNEIEPILELVSPDDKVVNTIELSDIHTGYTEKEYTNEIDILPPPADIAAVMITGELFCSSSTYNDGEMYTLNPNAMAIGAMLPGWIKTTLNGNKLHVECFKAESDEDDNPYLLPGTMASFDIVDFDAINTMQAKIQNLTVDNEFGWTSGDLPIWREYYKFNVTPELPMVDENTVINKDDDEEDSDIDVIGAKYAKVWMITQADGLKFSNFSFTRKDWDYKWDADAGEMVVEKEDEHTFSLLDNPGNTIQVIIAFK